MTGTSVPNKSMSNKEADTVKLSSRELFFRYKKIIKSMFMVGLFGYGGPMVTVAMMKDEFGKKREFINDKDFIEALAVMKIFPGPLSILMSVYLGKFSAKVVGALLSVSVYVLPSFLMIVTLACLEKQPRFEPLFFFFNSMDFFKVGVCAVVAVTCLKLFLSSWEQKYSGKQRPVEIILITLTAAFLMQAGVSQLLILVIAVLMGGFFFFLNNLFNKVKRSNSNKIREVSSLFIFMTFFKAGVTVFGTGYAILPYLQKHLVDSTGLIDMPTFTQSIAFGHLTPGPIVIASTYLGFQLKGLLGAVLATVGVFLGPTLLVCALDGFIKKIIAVKYIDVFLMGVVPTVCIIIAIGMKSFYMSIAWTPLQVFFLGITVLFAFFLKRYPLVIAVSLGLSIVDYLIKI